MDVGFEFVIMRCGALELPDREWDQKESFYIKTQRIVKPFPPIFYVCVQDGSIA